MTRPNRIVVVFFGICAALVVAHVATIAAAAPSGAYPASARASSSKK
jgi:hypothetical protein